MVTTLITAIAAVMIVAEPSAAAAPATPDSIDAQIRHIATTDNVSTGVWAQDLRTGRVIAAVNSEQRYPVLSMSKVYLAAAVLDAARHGLLRLDTEVPVPADHVVANSPITGAYAGRTLSYSEIAKAALQYSDNTAANLMFAAIGGPLGVTAYARTAGDGATVMVREETELNTAFPGDSRDTTTPHAWAAGLRSTMFGARLDPRDRVTLLGWMRGTHTSDKRFRAELPAGWSTADKTGTGDYGTANDAGLLYGPKGAIVLLVVQTRSSANNPEATARDSVIGRIAALVAADAARR